MKNFPLHKSYPFRRGAFAASAALSVIAPLCAMPAQAQTPAQTPAKPPVKTKASKPAAKKTARPKTTARQTGPARTVTSRSTKALVKSVQTPIAPVFKKLPPYRPDVPPGSFVVKPVRTDSAVYGQAISRSMILQRYQYAWKTTPEETLRRLQDLKLTQLKESGVYRVYYARPNGAWGYKVRRVPEGTFVFSLPDTPKPIMLQVCGNPVEEVLPPRNAKKKQSVPPFVPGEGDSGLVLEGLGDTGNLYGFAPQAPEFLDNGLTGLSGNSGSLMPIAAIPADSIKSFGGANFPLPGGGGFNLGNLLFPIVGTAIGSQVSNFGRNGGGGVDFPPIGNNGNNSPANGNNSPANGNNGTNIDVVPEPSGGAFGVAILGTLGLALLWPTLAKRRIKW